MAQVLGLIGDSLGIYSFIASLFANQHNNAAVVRVAAGLNGNGLSAADGKVDAIRLYNQNQQLIGNIGGGYVGSGGFRDFVVNQPNTQQASFVQIAATNDAICIPYSTITWVDGSKYGWTGDWGYKCGLLWYYSNVFVGNGNQTPRCTWIDNDHTNGIQAGMLYIHWPSFTDAKPEGDDPQRYCGWPAFRAYSDKNGGSGIFTRREIEGPTETLARKMKRAADTRLVITSNPTHNATALCESTTSHGPDLVSLFEQTYCNMDTRKTLPLCADNTATNCFNIETKQEQKKNARVIPKQFTSVIQWD